MGLMTMASGQSKITETIFENRFMHAGASPRRAHLLAGQTAIVEGVSRLKGAPVMATDLRASVSLVIAGLAAEGEMTVSRIYHLDRASSVWKTSFQLRRGQNAVRLTGSPLPG